MNASISLDNVCIIIPYRFSSPDRKAALEFVLAWLGRHLPAVEVLIVEQDEVSHLGQELAGNHRHLFLPNSDLFNKCWGYNAAAANTSREILVFNDSDMFMSREDYLSTIEACSRFDAVNPSATEIQNIINIDIDGLTFDIQDRKAIWTFAGGIFAIHKAALERVGGWNEDFEGWGAEDNELSFRILYMLNTIHLDCAMYHIEHGRGEADWKQQEAFDRNKRHYAEISTLAGTSLGRFVSRLQAREKGNPLRYSGEGPYSPSAAVRFVLAVVTFNNHDHLSRFIRQWEATRNKSALWTVVVADDGSSDGTLAYLESLQIEGISVKIIRNNHVGKAQQLNSILYYLESIDFDVCFVADPHISFIREGWDLDYRDTLMRTGYGMLCFYDKRWNPSRNLDRPALMGNLAGFCRPDDVQDFFFTLTPDAMAAIGYFDTFNLGTYGLERVDYIWRGCRAGFNALHTPFDVLNSNDYLKILKPFSFHYSQSYVSRLPEDSTVRRHAWKTILMSREYFPRNEIVNLKDKAELEARLILELRQQKVESSKRGDKSDKDFSIDTGHSTGIPDELLAGSVKKSVYTLADTGKIYKKGLAGLLEKTFKKSYNLMIRFRLRPMVRLFDSIAGTFLRMGIFMKNIDK